MAKGLFKANGCGKCINAEAFSLYNIITQLAIFCYVGSTLESIHSIHVNQTQQAVRSMNIHLLMFSPRNIIGLHEICSTCNRQIYSIHFGDWSKK